MWAQRFHIPPWEYLLPRLFFFFFNAGESSSEFTDAWGLIQELGAWGTGVGPAQKHIWSISTFRGGSALQCPTWSRGHRNLGLRPQGKALGEEAPRCGNEARVCAPMSPAWMAHCPIHECKESKSQTNRSLTSPPPTRLCWSYLKLPRVGLIFFLKSKMLIAQVWALWTKCCPEHPPAHRTTGRAGTGLWNFHVQFPHLPGTDPLAGTKELTPWWEKTKLGTALWNWFFLPPRHSFTARSC